MGKRLGRFGEVRIIDETKYCQHQLKSEGFLPFLFGLDHGSSFITAKMLKVCHIGHSDNLNCASKTQLERTISKRKILRLLRKFSTY